MSDEKKQDPFLLDAEEQWYEDHADQFVSAPSEVREQLIEAAERTRNKTERMNIRMTRDDMNMLKMLACREGIPYQSLVTSIIHKFIKGSFIDINEARKVLKLQENDGPVSPV